MRAKLTKRGLDWTKIFEGPWKEIFDSILPCMLGLSWQDVSANPNETLKGIARLDPQLRVASAFIVDIDGVWFIVTAGHVIEDELLAAEVAGRKIVKYEIMDNLGRKSMDCSRQPFPFDKTKCMWIQRGSGFDVALHPIPALISDNLKRQGACAVRLGQIANKNDRFHGYIVMGLPRDEHCASTSDKGSQRSVSIRMGIVALGMHGVVHPGFKIDRSSRPFLGLPVSLNGQYPDGTKSRLGSLKGMSGGPIWGIQIRKKGFSLKLVGIQTSCFEPSMVVTGTKFRPIADALHATAMKARRDAKATRSHAPDASAAGASSSQPNRLGATVKKSGSRRGNKIRAPKK